MPLVSKILDRPLRSGLPSGGCPADDKVYLVWRTEFVNRHLDLDLAIRWHDAANMPPTLEPWQLDYHLYDVLGRDPLFPTSITPDHRLRCLAVALKMRRRKVEELATRFVNERLAER